MIFNVCNAVLTYYACAVQLHLYTINLNIIRESTFLAPTGLETSDSWLTDECTVGQESDPLYNRTTSGLCNSNDITSVGVFSIRCVCAT